MFPILYKLTERKQVQQWQIVVENNTYHSKEGIVNGVITTNSPTVCQGKNIGRANETTPEEQAIKEAAAKHKQKLERGYFENIKDIEKGTSFYEPMLAADFKAQRNIKFPVASQPKLDGIRCIATKNGLFSRNGKEFTSVPHIIIALKPVFEKYPDLILDGELYCNKHNNNFNEICSLVKRSNSSETDYKAAEVMQYWIYDAPIIKSFTERNYFKQRYATLFILFKDEFKDLISDSVIKIVPTDLANSIEELDDLYNGYIEQGYEGQMVRILDSPYENKRSRYLLKRKDFIDEEYKIFNIVEGEGNRAGTAGHMEFISHNGKPFKSNIKGDFSYLTTLLQNREQLIGQMATIKYFNLTPDGIPRFPYVIAIRNYE